MRADLVPEWKKWESLCNTIRTTWNAGQRQKAAEIVSAAYAENPDFFIALWIKGIFLTDNGDIDGGRELLEQAIEYHPFPENCKRSYREVIAEVARQQQATYVDVNDLFRSRAPGPTPQSLYIDWCHPTPQGHGIIAGALFEAIVGDQR